MPPVVPIYKAHTLDSQLDEMSHLYLSTNVDIDPSKKIVTLPKLFMRDFIMQTPGKLPSIAALGYLLKVASYLHGDTRVLLNRLIAEYSNISIKYRNPSYRCRMIQQYLPTSHQSVERERGIGRGRGLVGK